MSRYRTKEWPFRYRERRMLQESSWQLRRLLATRARRSGRRWNSFQEPLDEVGWRVTGKPFGGGSVIVADFEKVVHHRQGGELALGQAMVPMVKEAEMAVASLNGRAGTLKQLGRLFDDLLQRCPLVRVETGQSVVQLLGRGRYVSGPIVQLAP